MRMRWLPREDDAIREVLPLASSLAEAATMLTKRLRRPVSFNSLRTRLGALGLTGLSSTLGRGLHLDPDTRIETTIRTAATVPAPEINVDIDPADWEDEEPTGPHERSPSVKDRDTERAPAPSEPPPDPVRDREARNEKHSDKRTIDRLVDQLREARARQGFLDAVASHRAPPRILPRERTSGIREMTPVVLASDWHVEETVEPESVAHRNEYNLAIAERRIVRFFQGIIWNIEHNRASGRIAIRDLVLWLGGDMMTGFIHEELMESNALSPTETILWLLPLLETGIRGVLDQLGLERVVIPCSYGNHGRTTHKPRISTGYANSFEWLMYHQLASRFRDEPRVHFEITASAHQYVDVFGKIIHFHHGDDVKYMGGVGGLGIPLLKAVPMWDRVRPADIHCIGHHHSIRDFGRALVNGSLIGYGPYSLRIRADFEEPQQLLFYVDSRRGKCMPFSIWVDDEQGDEPWTPIIAEAA